MGAAGNEEVACPLGRRFDQARRFDFEKITLVEEVPNRLDDLVADRQVVLKARAPQVEIAMLQAQRLVDVGLDVNGKGWDERTVEDGYALGRDLDLAGSELRVLGSRRAAPHDAANAHDVLVSDGFGDRERVALQRIEDRLRDPVAVAHVDEDQPAVIAPPIHPAFEKDRRPDVALRQIAAGAFSEIRHDRSLTHL